MRAELSAQCCRLCAISRGDRSLGVIDQPWLESDKYMAFVSVGALVDGWTLIAPKEHTLNLSARYGDAEFEKFVRATIAVVEESYGAAVVFEHGGQEEASKTSCGTSHAHLHIVPLAFPLSARARDFDPALTWVECSAAGLEAIVGAREYLFVSDSYRADGCGHVAILAEGRSQFFRRVIADELGRPQEFDYRIYPQLDVAERSARQLLAATSGTLDCAA
ncbi:HIT family protein [Lysobacter tyrosinilyticus]